jgi:hypothetical protein
VTPPPWKVYRCDLAPVGRACAIHGPPNLNSPYQVKIGHSEVVSDTNHDECCHMMDLADAVLIVVLHDREHRNKEPS